jgi:hypothetical protein
LSSAWGATPKQAAADLIGQMTDAQRREWSEGIAADWAQEAFALGRDHAYGMLPTPAAQGVYVLDAAYIAAEERNVRLQLSRAGVRLAVVLNRAFAEPRQK